MEAEEAERQHKIAAENAARERAEADQAQRDYEEAQARAEKERKEADEAEAKVGGFSETP